jgi:hypothetical protein
MGLESPVQLWAAGCVMAEDDNLDLPDLLNKIANLDLLCDEYGRVLVNNLSIRPNRRPLTCIESAVSPPRSRL